MTIAIGFTWSRAFKYECHTRDGRRRIKSVGRKREKLEPLAIDGETPLFRRFAELDGSEESCLRFAHHWGLLQSESPTSEEAIDDWQQQIQAMRQSRSMFGSEGDLPPDLRRKLRAGEAWKVTGLDVLLVPTSAETKCFSMVLQ